MTEISADQVATFEKLLKAGFRFVTVERAERYLGVERDGFVALLEPADGRIRLFGQAGYLMGAGIGMLVEKGEGKRFVWHEQSVDATPEMLASYEMFKKDLKKVLEDETMKYCLSELR